MLRALYGQFKRFLGWLNGGGYSVKDAADYRRDHESRYGGPYNNSGGGGGGF